MVRFSCPVCKALLEHERAGDKLPCPKCGQKLQVPALPANKTILGTWPPEPAAVHDQAPVVAVPAPPPRAEPKDERGKYCHECGQLIREKAEICPHCGVRQAGPPAAALPEGVSAHRGAAVLTLGIISASCSALGLLTCVTICALPFPIAALVTGIISWTMGGGDLRRMTGGAMDRAGEAQTRGGYVCGIIGTLVAITTLVVYVVLVVVLVAVLSSGPSYHGW